MIREADVLVIGGGLHGCSAALQLALRGDRVVLLERHHIARHSSGNNAGGVRTLARDVAEVALSVAGQAYWPRLKQLVGDDCGYVACGQIKVAESAAELAVLAERKKQLKNMGYAHEELIDTDELQRLVPPIARHCVGALIVRTDGAADPYRTTAAFAARARKAGVEIIEGEAITALQPQRDGWLVIGTRGSYRAYAVVNAAGAWAARVAGLAGDMFPLRTRASMMIVTERLPAFVTPVISAVRRSLSFKQTVSGTVLIGGGQQGRADLDREVGMVDVMNLSKAAQAATALFPRMAQVRIVRSWCGIEAETPDALPVIDVSPHSPGLVHVFGFSGHGFQLGPICGVAVADLVQHGRSTLPIAPFAATRFAPVAATAHAA